METTERLQKLLDTYNELRARSQFDDLSDLHEEALAHNMRVVEAISAVTRQGSTYRQQADKWIQAGITNARSQNYKAVLIAALADAKDGLL